MQPLALGGFRQRGRDAVTNFDLSRVSAVSARHFLLPASSLLMVVARELPLCSSGRSFSSCLLRVMASVCLPVCAPLRCCALGDAGCGCYWDPATGSTRA